MNIHFKNLLPQSAVLLCFGLLIFLPFLPKGSLASPEANPVLTRGRSITLKLTMPNGMWIRATEADRGQIIMRRDKTVLTLSPQIIGENKVVVTIRLFPNMDGTSPVLFEKSIEFETRSVYPPLKELARVGLGFDLTVEGIQTASTTHHPEEPSLHLADVEKPSTCCVTCGRVATCGCAVETNCGSCCSGSCCT